MKNRLTSGAVSTLISTPSESVLFISMSVSEFITTKTDALFSLLCTKNEFGILTMQALHVAIVGNHFTLGKESCDGKGF